MNASDVVVWSTIYPLCLDDKLSKEYLASNVNVSKWVQTVETTPEVKNALSVFKVTGNAYQALLSGAKYVITQIPTENPQSPQHQPEIVTNEELEAAKKAWFKDIKDIPKLKKQQKVVYVIFFF